MCKAKTRQNNKKQEQIKNEMQFFVISLQIIDLFGKQAITNTN